MRPKRDIVMIVNGLIDPPQNSGHPHTNVVVVTRGANITIAMTLNIVFVSFLPTLFI